MIMYALVIMGICLSVVLSAGGAQAEPRETFQYQNSPASFPAKDDWFGKHDKTRKQLELEKEKKQKEALKKEVERRTQQIEKQKAAEVRGRISPTNPAPRIERRTKKDVQAQNQQYKKSLRERAGNYPPPKTATPAAGKK